MIEPTTVPDRGHGYLVMVAIHDKLYVQEGPALVLLQHEDHYDVLELGSEEDCIEQYATLLFYLRDKDIDFVVRAISRSYELSEEL